MNRTRKEELRRHREARMGKSAEEVAKMDMMEEYRNEISRLAKKLHIENFSEEYDFMYDDHADMIRRKKGENPMSQEYIEQIRIKRLNLGISQLSESGMAVSDDTMNLCLKEAEEIINSYLSAEELPEVPDYETLQYIFNLRRRFRDKEF